MKEIWVDVSGFEGKYKISSLGRVKSLKRIVRTWNGTKTIPEKILKNSKSSNGYIRITLFKNNSHKKFSIHRLVAENFIPNIHNKPCVNHKDENKENNNVSNLEWVSWKENINYGTCLSRRAKTQKDKKCQLNNKSTSKKIICKNTGKVFPSINEACRFYGLDCSSVSKVCKKKINNTKGLKFEYV